MENKNKPKEVNPKYYGFVDVSIDGKPKECLPSWGFSFRQVALDMVHVQPDLNLSILKPEWVAHDLIPVQPMSEPNVDTYTPTNKTQIKISEILELDKRRKEINSISLDDIDFIGDDGTSIEIDPKNLKDFQYVGLNNMDFILTDFYKTGFEEYVNYPKQGLVYAPYVPITTSPDYVDTVYEDFMANYSKNHKYCPVCGDTGHSMTFVEYIFNRDHPEKYKDLNLCVCSGCGDKHTYHERVKSFEE